MPKKKVPAYDRMRRISLAVSPRLDQVLRTLGLESDGDRGDGWPADGATQVTSALARYSELVERASHEVGKRLNRAEWNYLADALNGCADLWDWSGTPISSLNLIRNVANTHSLDGAGDKWFGDGNPGTGDKATGGFIAKLAELEPIHGDAIFASVRWFWRHHQEIDHSEHKWWTIEYRTRRGDDA